MMCLKCAFLLSLVFGVSGVQLNSGADKNRPVTKVINLLKDMIEQLEKEGEQDEEVYEQMGCWCTTNDKEKTQAIKNGEGRIDDLSSAIEDLGANSARLNTQIENLNKEVAKNEEALESATGLRDKQLAEFNLEERDMLQSVTSLKGAVVALSKHHEGAFLQQSKSARELDATEAVATIEHQLRHHADLLGEVVTPHQRKLLAAFVQTPGKYLGETALLQQDQPQSGAIFGILKAMKESFETNLAQSQKEEAENNNAYLDLKKAKEQEIKAGQSLADTKANELAATDEKNAQSKQDLEDTRNTLAADTAYLTSLKETCQNVDHEYEARSETRQLEIQATSKALAFLSSDEAHDMFTRTFNPAFVQVAGTGRSAQRTRVAQVLAHAARKAGDARLFALAVAARGDSGTQAAFDKVKKTIQTMIDKLVLEKSDEIKLRDFCIEELTNNEADTDSKTRDKSDLEAKIEDLKRTIDELTRAIEDLKAAIAEAQVQLKRAGQNREKENSEFQVVVADQRATQKLLKAALGILKNFYDKAALVQTSGHSSQPAGPPPPPGFKSYERNASSGGVMGMMQTIIDDSKHMEEEAVRGEADGQKAYEEFVTETNASIDEMNAAVTNKTAAKAKAESDKVQAETERDGVMSEIQQLLAANADLHHSCDFTIKQFDLRQGTRDDEIDALKQAMAIFSGASFSAFIERAA